MDIAGPREKRGTTWPLDRSSLRRRFSIGTVSASTNLRCFLATLAGRSARDVSTVGGDVHRVGRPIDATLSPLLDTLRGFLARRGWNLSAPVAEGHVHSAQMGLSSANALPLTGRGPGRALDGSCRGAGPTEGEADSHRPHSAVAAAGSARRGDRRRRRRPPSLAAVVPDPGPRSPALARVARAVARSRHRRDRAERWLLRPRLAGRRRPLPPPRVHRAAAHAGAIERVTPLTPAPPSPACRAAGA